MISPLLVKKALESKQEKATAVDAVAFLRSKEKMFNYVDLYFEKDPIVYFRYAETMDDANDISNTEIPMSVYSILERTK